MPHHESKAVPDWMLPFGLAGDEKMQAKQDLSSTIHVWRISLVPCPAQDDGLARALAPAERARADRFRFPADRARWVRTRGIVRALLGGYLRCPPAHVPLTAGAHGKPILTPGFRANSLSFNWSHTNDLALLAVTQGGEVGIDVERVRTDFDPWTTAQSVFSAGELACLRDTAPAQSHALFFKFWTAKEALLKSLGTGFTACPTDYCAAALAQSHVIRTQGLTVRTLCLGGGHAAALASSLKDPQICGHDWHD